VKRILVIGAEGMLGQMLLGVLGRDPDLRVSGTARRSASGLLHFDAELGLPGLRRLFAPGTDPYDLVINAAGVRADAVDEAGSRSVRGAVVANALLPHDLAALSEETAARVAHVSTDAVFGRQAGACDEDSACAPCGVYGQTKSLGEPRVRRMLTFRCSLVGPEPLHRRGILEWLRGQPPSAQVTGFIDQLWSGITTLQFATLCRALADPDRFDAVRAESPIHHLCPNQIVTKCDLVKLLAATYRPDVRVREAVSGSPVNRTLRTRFHSLLALLGKERPLQQALADMVVAESTLPGRLI